MDLLEGADNGVVERRNDEGNDIYHQGGLRGVDKGLDGEVSVDILAMGRAGQNASTFIVAHATPCQDALWTFPDVLLVHFHPRLPSFTCGMNLAGQVRWNVE